MASPKEEMQQLLSVLPDDATWEDIQYHLYVRQKIERGIRASREGDVIPHAGVVKRMQRWTEK